MKKPQKNKPKITPPLDTFAGIKLEPMTKQREVTAAEMGMNYGFVHVYRSQFYLRDTIIVTWLRTIPAETQKGNIWSVDIAEQSPEHAMKEALKWAAKMGIGINSPRFAEAFNIFKETMRQIQEAKGEPVIPEHQEGEASPEPGEL